MIVYGSGGGVAVLGDFGEHQCPACGEVSQFSAVVNYKYAHIWYLFSFLTGRDYYLMCNNCQHGTPLEKAQVKQQFSKDNIPFIRRRGWLLCVSVVLMFVIWGMIGSRATAQKVAGLIADPKVSDIYMADLAQVHGAGFNHVPKAYGALRLESIDGDNLVFSSSHIASESKSDFASKLHNGTSSVRFDAQETINLSKDQVKGFHDRRVIHDIRRH